MCQLFCFNSFDALGFNSLYEFGLNSFDKLEFNPFDKLGFNSFGEFEFDPFDARCPVCLITRCIQPY